VPTAVVLLEDWEHWCCGERRRVGDEIELRFHLVGDVVYETRHPHPGEDFEVLTGQVAEIKWCRAICGRDEQGSNTVTGFEPGTPIATTGDHPATTGDDPAPDDDLGVLEFTLDEVQVG
jgi:hypothetical protein